jgi:lipopolysaccharide transport system ATP-binding protein
MAKLELVNAGLGYPLISDHAKSLRRLLANVIVGKTIPEGHVQEVRALSDISLDLHSGARLGLIGANGAGKSSLLRLMAGIYEPTEGRVIRSGKTVSMFDLSYGMDEEATGHENIEIAGTTLGMNGSLIQEVAAEVESFSELGSALERPIKTYSAGMRMRLTFGLVSSIHADILLIDEIIGVGDARFMKKASARIASKLAQTQVFVLASHAESVLRDFCTTGIVLEAGHVLFHGQIDAAIDFYNSRPEAYVGK